MSANAPAVSVVVPAFNAERFIAETLASALAQTFTGFEIIVVDDGSTDRTAEIVREFCKKDPRVQLIQQPNSGVSRARNAGIAGARGEWIAFLDSDDIWLPEKLARQMELAAADPRAHLIFTNYHAWDGERDLFLKYPKNEIFPEGDLLRHLISRFLLLPSTVMVRREMLISVGMFSEDQRFGEDWDMWLRLALKGLWARGVHEPLVRYRFWRGAVTSKKRAECLRANVYVLEKHFVSVTKKHPELREKYQRSLRNAQNHFDLLVSRQFLNDPKALAEAVLRSWRRERNFRLLKWYAYLRWPAFLGGRRLQRYVQNRVAALAFRGDQKDKWSLGLEEISFVSVIVPVFNGARFIAETLRSIQSQTFRDFEVIVVDDGSTDNTAAIIEKFCAEDSRFVLVRQKNSGVSAARNTGIQRARGEWLAFLDADDIWLPEKLEQQADLLHEEPQANLLFTNFYAWDGKTDLFQGFPADKPLPRGNPISLLIRHFLFLPSFVMVRREAVLNAGLFNINMSSAEDWDLWFRLALRGLHVHGTAQPLLRYRLWPGSTTAHKRQMALDANIRVLEKYFKQVTEKYPGLRRDFVKSINAAHLFKDQVVFKLAGNDVWVLSELCKNAWRRERNLKWLYRLGCCRWPAALGGERLRNSLGKKLTAMVPKNNPKNAWAAAPEISFVSIIIPVFNGESVVAETLRSVQAQTFPQFEVIVVDDGSTDNTAEIIREFCRKDPRFTLIQQKNSGASVARNTGIRHARADWIAFLDGDDVWLPEKLARQVALNHRHGDANLLFANYYFWDGQRDLGTGFSKQLPRGEILRELISRFMFRPSTVMVRREALLDAGLFDPQIKVGEDWDLWLRMALNGLRVAGTPEPLVRYRQWTGSLSAQNQIKMLENNMLVLKKNQPAIVKKFPDMQTLCADAVAHAEMILATAYDIAKVRETFQTDPAALSGLALRVWQREGRLKWLRWFIFLKWPLWLGGHAFRNAVQKKFQDQFRNASSG